MIEKLRGNWVRIVQGLVGLRGDSAMVGSVVAVECKIWLRSCPGTAALFQVIRCPSAALSAPIAGGSQSRCDPGRRCNPCAIAERDRPQASPSSIYYGGLVQLLQGDHDGIVDCGKIG